MLELRALQVRSHFRSNVCPCIACGVAGALAIVVHCVFNLLVADVAEQLIAINAVHHILSTLLRVDRFARRALDAPLDVDVGVPFVAHILDHLLSDRSWDVKVLNLDAFWILLEVHRSLSFTATRPTHVSPALSTLKLGTE
jgi:hypothetical protein